MFDLRKNKSEDNVELKSKPIDIATSFDGKKLWVVKSIKNDCEYKLWAYTYEEALKMLPMIESF